MALQSSFLPQYLCPELIHEYLLYLPMADVDCYSQVSRSWVGPSKAITLRTFNLGDRKQTVDLERHPEFGRFVRTMIVPLHLNTAVYSCLSCIPHLTALEFHGFMHYPGTLAPLIQSFSTTLESCIFHDTLLLSPNYFDDLLAVLSSCPNLLHLSLPNSNTPPWVDVFSSPAIDLQGPFLGSPKKLARKPDLITLKLVATAEYNHPCSHLADDIGTKWHWLADRSCPFNLTNIINLAIGNIMATRLLLPQMGNLRTLEFATLLANNSNLIQEFVELVSFFPPTLDTFILPSNVRISFHHFTQILAALGQCAHLLNLTLPYPDIPPGESQTEVLDAFQLLSPRVLSRPRLQFLQLVSLSERCGPGLNVRAYKVVQAFQWEWVEDPLCPFDLQDLQKVVVGSASVAQRILPLAQDTLTHLEFCSPLDVRSFWTGFEELHRSPLMMSRLTFIRIATSTWVSSWILDVIKAPMIETVIVQWTTNLSPIHLQTRLQNIDTKVANLDSVRPYPKNMATIRLVLPYSAPNKPEPEWYKKVFSCASAQKVDIFVEYT